MTDDSEHDESLILVEGPGSGDLVGVFEDDGDTGYLYIYDTGKPAIVHALHIYNRTPALTVEEHDVFVTWSEDFTKCGVVIWDDMRGVIDLRDGVSRAAPLRDRTSPGISDPALLAGFLRED